MRDKDVDSVKGLLIFLVVLGHFLEKSLGWGNELNRILLSTIYFIHMPAFIFISGMFFKANGLIQKLIYFLSLLIPFQIAYVAFHLYLTEQSWSWAWFKMPYWILWYLCGMIAWCILTPLLKRTGLPVLIAIFLSILIGFSSFNNYLYSIGRILTFLPFFVIGHLYGAQLFQQLKSDIKYRWFGVAILALVVFISMSGKVSHAWLYGSFSFAQMAIDPWIGSVKRLLIFILSLAGVFALFTLTPWFRNKWMSLGQHTLPIYLLHGFVVILATRYIPFPNTFTFNLLFCILLSLLTCWMLKQNVFERMIKLMTGLLRFK